MKTDQQRALDALIAAADREVAGVTSSRSLMGLIDNFQRLGRKCDTEPYQAEEEWAVISKGLPAPAIQMLSNTMFLGASLLLWAYAKKV